MYICKMQFLLEAITTSLAIIGLYYATSYELDKDKKPTEKMVLWWFRYYVDKWIGEPFGKPIILCPQCMASLWGVIFYFGVFHHPNSDVLHGLVFILVTSALNKLIQTMIER